MPDDILFVRDWLGVDSPLFTDNDCRELYKLMNKKSSFPIDNTGIDVPEFTAGVGFYRR